MVNPSDSVNPKVPPSKPPSINGPQNQANNWNPAPLTWMGMQFDQEDTKKLWTVITQTVATAIQRDSARWKKTLKKLRKSLTGES